MPDFPSGIFDTESITLRPRLPSTRGSGGAPGVAFGPPVTLPAQIDPVSSEVAILEGIEDTRAVWEVHLSSDLGASFDEGTTVMSASTGPAVVIRPPMVWAPNHVVLAVQGRR
jgi:hypothetical protein